MFARRSNKQYNLSYLEDFEYKALMKKMAFPLKLQGWIDARRRFCLSHVQVQMAMELGLNPKKFGSLANHKQEHWKESLPDFIETLYFKQFSKLQPDNVKTIEQLFALQEAKKKVKKEAKIQQLKGRSEPDYALDNPLQHCQNNV